MFHQKASFSHASRHPSRGFTLIELMIVVAIIAIILTLALPVYSNYTIRAKVGEALSVTAGVKASVADTCQAEPTILALTPQMAGVEVGATLYLASIDVSGPCTAPVISIATQNTGATPSPGLTLTGDLNAFSGRMAWNCTTDGLKIYVPRACRGS